MVFPLFWRPVKTGDHEVIRFDDNQSVTLAAGIGLCINSLQSGMQTADSVLWRLVSPGALAAWQVPHLTEARLNVLDGCIALPGVPQWQQNA